MLTKEGMRFGAVLRWSEIYKCFEVDHCSCCVHSWLLLAKMPHK